MPGPMAVRGFQWRIQGRNRYRRSPSRGSITMSLRYLTEDDLPPGIRRRLKATEKPPEPVQVEQPAKKRTRAKTQSVQALLAASMTEQANVVMFRQYLALHGWTVIKHHPIRPYGERRVIDGETWIRVGKVPDAEAGFPDLILLHPRVPGAFLLEVKRPGERPNPDQQRFQDSFQACLWADTIDRLIGELGRLELPGGTG